MVVGVVVGFPLMQVRQVVQVAVAVVRTAGQQERAALELQTRAYQVAQVQHSQQLTVVVVVVVLPSLAETQ
jgi:hypothetical protein